MSTESDSHLVLKTLIRWEVFIDENIVTCLKLRPSFSRLIVQHINIVFIVKIKLLRVFYFVLVIFVSLRLYSRIL